METVLVRMEGIEKRFPGVHALDGCQFELAAGEVHSLCGENGAGKSTMMKVLAGIVAPDAGHIFYQGREVSIGSPRAAQQLGISMVHQELNLMPHLTIAQNIFIGREPRRAGVFLSDRDINTQARELFERMHMQLDPSAKVGSLTVAKQQMVEIAKAISYNSRVLIMDEPTAALTETEIADLFRIIRGLQTQGVGIVHISHRMEEIKQIANRVTVMRDGRYIKTLDAATTSIDQIISLMVGRTIFESAPELPETPNQENVLEVRHLNRGTVLKDINFSLKRGEILGVAGLVGAGRTEMARAVFGADPIDSGEIYVKGQRVQISSPTDAVAHSIGYLSEDRKRYGLVLGMDVETNTVLASFRDYLGALGWVNEGATQKTSQRFVDALRIKTPSVKQKAKNLSGGNQQKIVIGKWLARDCDILIFDEPTRGIDVGAKSEIYRR